MRLTWYIIRLHIGPLLFGTFAVVFIFLLQFIFKALNNLIGKGLDYWIITKLITLNLAWMLVLALPMGVLVSTLMAYGKLSGSNELTIVKSSGGSAFRVMMPAIIGGAFLFLALFLFNDRILPEANHQAMVLQSDIQNLNKTFAIEPGQFSTMQGYSILARKVDRERDELLDVSIYNQDGEMMNVINAKKAKLSFASDFSRFVMDLSQGEVQQIDRRKPQAFRRFTFGSYRVTIPISGYNFNQSDPSSFGRGDRTMNISDMKAIADTALGHSAAASTRIDAILTRQLATLSAPVLDTIRPTRAQAIEAALGELATVRMQLESESINRSEQKKTADQYYVEIHKKYSIPAACFVFVFVGAPLGILVRRGNFGVSAAIALGFFVIYWACLVTGEKLADRQVLSPAVAMWMADFVIGLMGVYLTILVSRETVTFNFDFSWLKRKKVVVTDGRVE